MVDGKQIELSAAQTVVGKRAETALTGLNALTSRLAVHTEKFNEVEFKVNDLAKAANVQVSVCGFFVFQPNWPFCL